MNEQHGLSYMAEQDKPLEDSSMDIASLATIGGAGLAAAAAPFIRNKLATRAAEKELAALTAQRTAKEAADMAAIKASQTANQVSAANKLGYKSVDDMEQAFMNHPAFNQLTDNAFATFKKQQGRSPSYEEVQNGAIHNMALDAFKTAKSKGSL